jgi:transcriptional regulator with XRE-family HTH domain
VSYNSTENTIEIAIGQRLRNLRRKKAITLDKLSKKTGLSKGLLSKIENGKVSSPVSTLAQIAEALKVKLSYLVDGEAGLPERKYALVRRGQRVRLDKDPTSFGLYMEMLAHQKPNKLMEPSILVLEPNRSEPVIFTHPGEEMLFVLTGEMEFNYGGEIFTMQEGDSLYFDSTVPHGGRNLGKDELRVLMVICEP